MSPGALGAVLLACLGAGAADLTLLNLTVVPRLYDAAPVAVRRAAQPSAPSAARASTTGPAPTTSPSVLFGAAVTGESRSAEPAPRLRLVTILEFELSAHHLVARERVRLTQSVPALRGAARVVVVGHADTSGPEEFNERLSGDRAAAMVRRLVERGIPRERIDCVSRGEREPRANGNSRRVEIYIIGGES